MEAATDSDIIHLRDLYPYKYCDYLMKIGLYE